MMVSLIFSKRSLVFPIFFFSFISLHWSQRKSFLSLFAILWNSPFKWVYISLSPLPLAFLIFSAICKVSSNNHFALLHFFFLVNLWRMAKMVGGNKNRHLHRTYYQLGTILSVFYVMNAFDPHCSPVKDVLLLSLFYRRGNWGIEWPSNLAKITMLYWLFRGSSVDMENSCSPSWINYPFSLKSTVKLLCPFFHSSPSTLMHQVMQGLPWPESPQYLQSAYHDEYRIAYKSIRSLGFPGGVVVKNPPASAGDIRDMGLIPGSGRSPGGGYGHPLQYTCVENPMDRGAWLAIVLKVAKSRTQLKQLSMHAH